MGRDGGQAGPWGAVGRTKALWLPATQGLSAPGVRSAGSAYNQVNQAAFLVTNQNILEIQESQRLLSVGGHGKSNISLGLQLSFYFQHGQNMHITMA